MKGLVLAVLLVAFTGASTLQKKIICYFPSWASYRPGNGKFDVEHIPAKLCTHLIYSFVGIGNDGSVKILDEWNDLSINGGKGSIARFNGLRKRNPNLKTIAAIGGWNEGSQTFSTVVNNDALRRNFVNNIVNFVRSYGFDGFDLDWEYPAQRGGSPSDKAAFSLLIKELRREFDKYGFSLSAAVPAGRMSVATSYDMAELGKYLDFINIMTYDFHGSQDPVTGHNAPLYARSTEKNNAAFLNVDSSIRYWIENGVPRNKLILGVPAYGRTWTLQSASNTELGSPTIGAGNPGPYTREAGMLGFNEICENLKAGGWTTQWDDKQLVPYAFRGNQWISYDNVQSIKRKVKYAVEQDLGGVMVWSIDTDDFHGVHDGTKFPILNAINAVFNGGGNSYQNDGQNSESVANASVNNDQENTPGTSTEVCKIPGYIMDPYNCSKFYYCMLINNKFIKYPLICPDGLEFDKKAQVCNYKYMVDCN